MTSILYYVHDPMCSWCWGFAPAMRDLLGKLPADIEVRRLLGGLATDSSEPMPVAMQATIRATWLRIQEQIPGTVFNYDFWTHCIPRRSTWLSCRAVIAARLQNDEQDMRMTQAIQRAYYTEALNPSDAAILVALAGKIGLDEVAFGAALHSDPVQETLLAEIDLARQLHVSSFPSLVLEVADSVWPVPVDYRDSTPMLDLIAQLSA